MGGRPDPAAYAALLKASYPVIKAAEPNATVLVGGLTGNDYPYLEALYQDGAKGYLNAVAVATDTACNIVPYSFLRENNGSDARFLPRLPRSPRRDARQRRRQADLDDRALLAHHLRRVRRRGVGRTEGPGRRRTAAGHLSRSGL